MTYTIEELEGVLAEWDSATHRGKAIILHGITALETIALKRQLLDTMRALEAAQMRIEAAAAIEEAFPAFGYPTDYAQAASANEMRAKFRAALGLEGE